MLNYQKTDTWKQKQKEIYGPLHRISSRAAVIIGYNAACIIGHLYFLQCYTPKGGYIPYTPEGLRCAYNSIQQIHERLPFISETTIKNQIAKLHKKFPGFRVFQVEGYPANHFYITPELAEELDLDNEGTSLYFHEREALQFGVLDAILLQRVSYCNAALAAPMKEPQYVVPDTDYKRYAARKRTVTRALSFLSEHGSSFNVSLLEFTEEHGYKVDQLCRENYTRHWMAQNGVTQKPSVKFARKSCRSYLHQVPTSDYLLPELPTQEHENNSQFAHVVTVANVADPLNRSNQPLSTSFSKTAAAPPLSRVPSVPSESSVIIGHGLECHVPSKASPVMDRQDVVMDASMLNDSNAQRASDAEMNVEETSALTSVMDVAQPKPCPELPSVPSPTVQRFIVRGGKGQDRSGATSVYNETTPQGPVEDATKKEFRLSFRFREVVNQLELVPDASGQKKFTNELRNNPELGEKELEIIYARAFESMAQKHHGLYRKKFHPFYHSSELTTTNQFVGKFYLILLDHYRVTREQHFGDGRAFNDLRDDTPEHVRRYIERKQKNSSWTKDN